MPYPAEPSWCTFTSYEHAMMGLQKHFQWYAPQRQVGALLQALAIGKQHNLWPWQRLYLMPLLSTGSACLPASKFYSCCLLASHFTIKRWLFSWPHIAVTRLTRSLQGQQTWVSKYEMSRSVVSLSSRMLSSSSCQHTALTQWRTES